METRRRQILADAGSTKTEWCLLTGGDVTCRWTAGGLNPVYLTDEDVTAELTANVLPRLVSGGTVDEVRFYGAGCTGAQAERMRRLLLPLVRTGGVVQADTDMLGAAIALCGNRPGIACILGTGSNSCFFDGSRIVSNVPPLGFILGDEGSGAVLGKLLAGHVLKRLWPPTLCEAFHAYTGMDAAAIIDRVYRRPFPNRFLASLTPFLSEHIDEPLVRRLVTGSFRDFFQRNVRQYDYLHHEAHFTGSVAWHFRPLLTEAAEEAGVSVGKVMCRPMDGLLTSFPPHTPHPVCSPPPAEPSK